MSFNSNNNNNKKSNILNRGKLWACQRLSRHINNNTNNNINERSLSKDKQNSSSFVKLSKSCSLNNLNNNYLIDDAGYLIPICNNNDSKQTRINKNEIIKEEEKEDGTLIRKKLSSSISFMSSTSSTSTSTSASSSSSSTSSILNSKLPPLPSDVRITPINIINNDNLVYIDDDDNDYNSNYHSISGQFIKANPNYYNFNRLSDLKSKIIQLKVINGDKRQFDNSLYRLVSNNEAINSDVFYLK
jgi:hypothetical protein